MIKKLFMASLFVFSGFAFGQAQEVPPVLSVDVDTELRGKRLELLEVKQPVQQVASESLKPPVSLPKPSEKVELKNEDKKPAEDVAGNIDSGLKSDMDNLHAVISGLLKSLEKGSGEGIAKNFNESFGALFTDQEFVSDSKGVVEFFDKINKKEVTTFGGMVLEEKFNIKLSKDGVNANVFGRGIEKYKIQDQFYEVPISWSANLEKFGEGWKILSFHSGANFLDNEIITSYEKYGIKMMIIGVFLGVFIGFVIGFIFIFVRKKQ